MSLIRPRFPLRLLRLTLACFALLVLAMLVQHAPAQAPTKASTVPLNERQLATRYFGNDAPWYLPRIPFLEIDDPEIQQVYYYRWQVYRSHLREIGQQGTDETEFLPDVPWARHPFTDLNDSSSFHILEGRWLRDTTPVTSLVDHLYAGAGNDRHFSESIAAATLEWVKVTGDAAPALRHLDTMEHVFNLWDDHFDAGRNLYWIEPLLDATEYTISSIDASGAGFTDHPSTDQNHNGFTGGYAFRPSINAFQYGNALAIAQFATLAGQQTVARDYAARAEALRRATLAQLWNPRLGQFTDVYQRSTATVHAGDFIRGRELVGLVPWQFNLPPVASLPGQPDYASAWLHLLNASELGGPHGPRTVEPTYPKYLAQYRYDASTGLRECQWNGPSWPFQTSQALTGMANLLQASQQHTVTPDEYVRLLRQYAHLHLNAQGHPDIQEDYDPDTGQPIVGLPRSHHYLHSTFNDLVLSGLVGIRPTLDDTLLLNPLLPTAGSPHPIRFFALQDLRYHGRTLTILYDADGTHYHQGSGLSVFAAGGRRLYGPRPLGPAHLSLAQVPRTATAGTPRSDDLAVNVWERQPSTQELALPIATASSTAPNSNPYQAIDGRLWFFPEIPNGWSPVPTDSVPVLTLDLRQPRRVTSIDLAFFADTQTFAAPVSIELQTSMKDVWTTIPGQQPEPVKPSPNGVTHLEFSPVITQQLRLVVHPTPGKQTRLIEMEAFDDPTQAEVSR